MNSNPYSYMPKYCKEFCLQGHDEDSYWKVHQKVHDKKMEEKEE